MCEDAYVCVRTVWSEGKTEASQLSWVTSDWLKRFLCIGEVNALHTPSLPVIPYTVTFSVGGERAHPILFSWGEISEQEVLTALLLQGRGKEGAVGCGGLPVLDGSRGVAGRAV